MGLTVSPDVNVDNRVLTGVPDVVHVDGITGGVGGSTTIVTESLWTDDNGIFYIRVNTGGTITWTFANGTATSAPGASGRPAAGPSIIMDRSAYQATAAGTGYSIGDFVNHYVTADPATGAVIAHFWINATTEQLLGSAPSSANISPISTTVVGSATSAKQDTGNTSLASLDTKTPALVAGASPVSLPAATVATLTPPAAITGFATAAAQTAAQTSLSSLDTKTPALIAGAVPVSLPAATVTALTPPAAITGFATAAAQTAAQVSLASLDTKTPALVAGATPVSLPAATVTALTPPAAITGFATSANQATEITALGTLHTDLVTNHADLVTLHADVGTTLHADLGSILTQETATNTVLGTKADAANAATDATPISAISIWKQISKTLQAFIAGLNPNGRALPTASAPVVLNSMTYVPVAVSATQQCGATGATGDYLDGVLIIPGAAAAGIVQIKDGSGAAITIFAGGGTTALPTLAPFFVPFGAISSGGAGGWKIITNLNVTAIGVGNFT
jgi:hypothetical protein